MLIDWFTVGAQAINFLILVWLLKHFLYKPVLDAIDAREKGLAAQLADSAAKQAEAERAREEFRRRNEAFDRQRAALLAQAEADARNERTRLFTEAREAADLWSSQQREALDAAAKSLTQTLAQRTQEEVFAIARKTLIEGALDSLEQSLADAFERRLHELGGKAREEMAAALSASPRTVLIRSAFDLSESRQREIEDALRDMFSRNIAVEFQTRPDLIGGIELACGGQRFAWSIADYLASMEKNVSDLLISRGARE